MTPEEHRALLKASQEHEAALRRVAHRLKVLPPDAGTPALPLQRIEERVVRLVADRDALEVELTELRQGLPSE